MGEGVIVMVDFLLYGLLEVGFFIDILRMFLFLS